MTPTKTFKDLNFEQFANDPLSRTGKRSRIYFDNGYGASVVSHTYSYGGPQGLYEIAVLRDDEIVYDTPVTSDVIGYLEEDEVTDILSKIQQLPRL